MVIDFHTHVFPPNIAGRAIASLEKTGGFPAHGDGTLDGLLANMEQGGADLSVILPVVTNVRQVGAVNDYIISISDNKQIICFGGIHPDMPNIKEEIIKLKKAGLNGIKIHPDFVRTFADDNKIAKVINLATEQGMPVILHGGADPSFPDYVRCSPDIIAGLLPKIPGAKLVCAHLLGYTYFDRLLAHLDEFLKFGLYLDISMTLDLPKSRDVLPILEKYDSSKILFATDYPWKTVKETLSALNELPISDEYKEKIKWKNAAALLEI